MTLQPKPHVGDVIYYLRSSDSWATAQPVTVTKVGRKYFSFDANFWRAPKVSFDDWILREHPYGCCFRSEEHWRSDKEARDAVREADRMWLAFHRQLGWRRPPNTTAATIKQVCALLGFKDGTL